ncbi:MAG: P-II family nitrogen regulator [candidate division Zixibacteria bacterium]|nr:P-II family nitrogen regulator [candidate division Zixibacteria bacterium]
MKEIKAYIRRSKMDDIVHGLKAIGVKAMSVIPVEGIGALADPEASELSLNYVTNYSMVYKLEIVCRESDAHCIVDTLLGLARTGAKGDGVIFISDIERAIKIRSGEEGEFTLDSPTDETGKP